MRQLVLLACLSACAALMFPTQECGRTPIPPRVEAEDRIVDGTEAVPGSWPWHAGLHGHPFFDSLYFCGGVLISKRFVLTAAHCVTFYDPKLTFVHLGSHLREIRDDTEVSVPVEHMCMHKDEAKDIAIIKLAKDVNFTDTIQPACLPDAGSELPDRTTLYVTGWGQTDEGDPQSRAEVLQQTKTLSVTNSRCRKEYVVAHDHEICTSHESGSTCHADSGGPLVRQSGGGKWTVEGLVARGPKLCRSWTHRPMRYTKLSYFISWIEDYLRADKHGDLDSICVMAPDVNRKVSK